MDFLRGFQSKKTSEAGVWISDEEVLNCGCCGVKFSLLIRKHHCRQCGGVVCGSCSENRKFMESSRSGAPKRVCDKCFADDRGYGGSAAGQRRGDEEDEEEDSGAAPDVAKLTLAEGDASYPRRTAVGRLPDVSLEEAVAALQNHPFDGAWQAILLFTVVDMNKIAPSAMGEAAKLQAFKPTSIVGKAAMNKDGTVKVNSRVRLLLKLEVKGGSYFRGTCGDFGQFGHDGKLTGSVQKSTGKVNMTLQTVSTSRVTTSFNFVGLMNSAGVLAGTFSGCEISRAAGSASGTFKMMRMAPTDEEGGDGEGRDDDDDDAEDDEPAPKSRKGASAPAKDKAGSAKKGAKASAPARRKGDDSSDEDDGSAEEPAARGSDDDDSDDSDDSDAPKAKAKAKAAAAAKAAKAAPAKKPQRKASSDDDSGTD